MSKNRCVNPHKQPKNCQPTAKKCWKTAKLDLKMSKIGPQNPEKVKKIIDKKKPKSCIV